ncbi:hypothetical protein ACQ4WY_25710 [Janthinobacterium sp. LB2P49]|uniref:hypothetical protein n=1 Tax=Janthinobacterium sp. LB2P49 TaxID=3424198 RepID=UPI003F287B84
MTPIIDFDEIDDWAPKLATALSQHVPSYVGTKLASAAPQYPDNAMACLFDLSSRCAVVAATLTWIQSSTIASYHGSRLTTTDVESIRLTGLIPLKAEARRNRLVRALSSHVDWPNVADQLDSTLRKYGQKSAAGRRQHQVHLTLSKAGLKERFNHYLTYGAEFDQHVACALLGKSGVDLLARDGRSTLIRIATPGVLALNAAHPHFSVDEMQARDEIPNLAREFLKAWSYRLAHPEFQSRTLTVDCGMVFNSIVPAGWIVSID